VVLAAALALAISKLSQRIRLDVIEAEEEDYECARKKKGS
jgi:hypothetical protein